MNREAFRKKAGELGFRIIEDITMSLGSHKKELENKFADFAEAILDEIEKDDGK